MADTVTHLPGCNMKHGGGNWQWTCRYQLALPDPRTGSAEPAAQVTVSADGPCTGSGTVEVEASFTAYVGNDIDLFANGILPWLQQALVEIRPTFLDWEQRSQCQHPEDQECPE